MQIVLALPELLSTLHCPSWHRLLWSFWSLRAYRYCCSMCKWWYHTEKKTCLVPPWLFLPRRFFLSSKLEKHKSSSFFYATLSSPLLLSPKMSWKVCSFSLKFPKRTFYPGIISCLRKFRLIIFLSRGRVKIWLIMEFLFQTTMKEFSIYDVSGVAWVWCRMQAGGSWALLCTSGFVKESFTDGGLFKPT